MKEIGFYAGSFDPFTKGHLAIVCRAIGSYDKLIIGIGVNEEKKELFPEELRRLLVESSINDFVESYKNRFLNNHYFSGDEVLAAKRLIQDRECLTVVSYKGLTVDAALEYGATALIRGERIVGDHDTEVQLAMLNAQLLNIRRKRLELILMPLSNEKLTYISSSRVKSLYSMGEYIAAMHYVMPSVHAVLARQYLKERYLMLMERCLGLYYTENDFPQYADSCWQKVVSAYESRFYHTLSHVAYALNLLDIYGRVWKEAMLSDDEKALLEYAIFYHDIVVRERNAEEKSACRAQKDWSKMPDSILVKNLIMATRHDGTQSEGILCKLMHDIDLAILGDRANYGMYAQSIRQEYADVPTEDYAKGRCAVLKRFFNADKLYQMQTFEELFADEARQNMQQEFSFWRQYL